MGFHPDIFYPMVIWVSENLKYRALNVVEIINNSTLVFIIHEANDSRGGLGYNNAAC